MEDEASEFRFNPTTKEDARVFVVASVQPNVRAMRNGEVLGRRSGVGPVVANYSRGADTTVHIARLWFCTVVCHFYDDTILFGCSWERGGAQDCYRQLQNCLHRRHSRVRAYLARGRSRVSATTIVWSIDNALSEGRAASCVMDKLRFLSLHVAAVSSEALPPPSAGTVIVLLPQFAQLFLQRFLPKCLHFGQDQLGILPCWSDAMWDPPSPAGLGFFSCAQGMPAPSLSLCSGAFKHVRAACGG